MVHFRGRRKAKAIGTSKSVAEKVRRAIEERLALGDLTFFEQREGQSAGIGESKAHKPPTFEEYSTKWLGEHAELNCKPSTVSGYRQILRLYLLPRFASTPLANITRNAVKELLVEAASSGKYSRNTVRLILGTIRCILNAAVDDEDEWLASAFP